MTTWTKTLRDGSEVLGELQDDDGSVTWRVTVNGEVWHTAAKPRPVANPGINFILRDPEKSATKPGIGLEAAEFRHLRAISDAARDAAAQRRDEAKTNTPRERYDVLSSELFNARRELRKLVDHDEHGEPVMESRARDRIAAAEAELDTFAENHPNVIEQVRSEEEQRTADRRIYADDNAINNIVRLKDQ